MALFLILPSHADPASALVLHQDSSLIELENHLYVLEDPNKTWTFKDIQSASLRSSFVVNPSSNINHGFSRSAYWYYTPLTNRTGTANTWYLELDDPLINRVTVYTRSTDGKLTKMQAGSLIPASEKPIKARSQVFPIHLDRNETTDLYIHAVSDLPLFLPMSLWQLEPWVEKIQLETFLFTLYFGVILAMIIYNFFIYLSVRDNVYIAYVCFLIGSALYFMSTNGFTTEYVVPEHPEIALDIIPLAISIMTLFGIIFSIMFLELAKDNIFRRLLTVLALAALATPILTFAMGPKYGIMYGLPLGACACVIGLTVGYIEMLRGSRVARFYCMAWTVFLFGVIVVMLVNFGLLPKNTITYDGVQAGSAIEALLLSFALAYKIKLLRNEKARAQERAMALEREAMSARELALKNQYQAQLKEAEANAKSDFLANMSHEIRTPMNGVIGITELLKDTPLNLQQQEYVSIIQNSGSNLLAIINDILDFSKIEAGKLEIEQIHFDLHKLIAETAKLFSVSGQFNQDISFNYRIAPSVPKEVIGDPVRIRQILTNYLSNAFKFTNAGTVDLDVCKEQDGQISFAVIDSGIGLTKEAQSLLFQNYQQADRSTARKFGGTGLGLTICKMLAELMQGSVGVSSEYGQGSRFWVRLPLPEVTTTGQPLSINQLADTTDISFRDIPVLIAEDNSVNQMVISNMLAKLEVPFTLTENGKEAFEVFKQSPFPVILMDCEMPLLNGYEAARSIRHFEQEQALVPSIMIALTANVMEAQKKRCQEAGMDLHLAKPLTLKALRSTLIQAVQMHQSNHR